MRSGGRAMGAVLCGMLLVTLTIWLVRQGGMEPLEPRPAPQVGTEVSVLDRGKVNINLASQEQLEQLPGIGPTRAQAIVRYREIHGYFVYPEHLIQVSGISQTTVEKLLDQICV